MVQNFLRTLFFMTTVNNALVSSGKEYYILLVMWDRLCGGE